jgi:hypothetical protein
LQKIISKMRLLLWFANVGTYSTTRKLAAFTNTSPVCANCDEAPATVAYALVKCRLTNTSWNRVHGAMLI